jgi:hypothetical protein
MNRQTLVARRIGYFLAIGVLLFPLVMLGSPASRESAGGKLAHLRAEHKLGQSHFGQVDAASETIKLASLGLEGVAAMTLWQKAYDYKKTENWAAYEATLNQIAKIMPNYVNVWKFQAWNLSYNLAVEFDDYRHRYQWVKKGIDFLKQGYRYNERDPRILWDIGWFTCQKIGRSDEQKEFRRMYKEEFGRDNWLVGKEWYLAAQRLVDTENIPFRGMNQAVFHSHPGIAQMYYAKAIQGDGLFLDEHRDISPAERQSRIDAVKSMWRQAWLTAQKDWFDGPQSFGEREFSIGHGVTVRLNEHADQLARYNSTRQALYRLNPEAADKLLRENDARLQSAERNTLKISFDKRSAAEQESLATALVELELAHALVERLPAADRVAARRVADDAVLAKSKLDVLYRLLDPVNFAYWKTRSQAEATEPALAARAYFDEAQRAHRQARLLAAKRFFELGFEQWAKVLNQYPELAEDIATGSDVADMIVDYHKLVVDELDGEFPKDFILQKIIDEHLPFREEGQLFKQDKS